MLEIDISKICMEKLALIHSIKTGHKPPEKSPWPKAPRQKPPEKSPRKKAPGQKPPEKSPQTQAPGQMPPEKSP